MARKTLKAGSIIGLYSIIISLLGTLASASSEKGVQVNLPNEAAWIRPLRQGHHGYAPYAVNCPQPRPNIRNSTSISPEETEWLEKRQNNTVWALRDFLSRANISGFDANGYLDRITENGTALPNVGIAVSGGGWRALMNGAGAIAAFDNTTTNSTSPGHVGGLLQTATYLTGLSGGSWLVGSLYVPQLRSVQELYRMDPNAPDSLWQFDNSIVEGSSGTSPSAVHTDDIGPTTLRTSEYYDQITDEVENKENVGFNTTITDLWGRGLSFQLFNAKDGGPSKDRSLITLGFLLIRNGDYTFSNLTQNGAFQSAQVPLPIIVAIERPPNQLLILGNSSIYEINPWEIGTFDPPTTAFAPLQYVGSNFSGGIVLEGQSCVSGFDNMGFVVGTSSSLFNQAYLQVNNTSLPSRVVDYVSRKLEEIGNENNDVSYWTNPFYQFNPAVNMNAKNRILPLVDGGEDLQNIPLHPLLQPPRKVDVIFAVDSSADTSSPGAYWPNGTSLVATYQRSLLKSGHGFPFPVVPDQNTFVNLGLNSKPTFFGCDPENTTQPTPLIVYLPNSPYTYYSNISTFQMETNDTQRNSIIQNGYDVATRGNGSVDSDWPACLGCALLARSFWKTQTETPSVCQDCFTRYCWNGTTDPSTPAPYMPTHVIKMSGCSRQAVIAFTPVIAFVLIISMTLL